MWNWDQGRLAYFQFDALRRIATYVTEHDFMAADKDSLLRDTGLPFSAPDSHSPWRNYSRVLKLCLLVSQRGSRAEATPVAQLLSKPGQVTCDEYLHFLARSSTSPSPALQDWNIHTTLRYPLIFSLKYLLTKTAIRPDPVASLDEIIGAYAMTGLTGAEDDVAFINVVNSDDNYHIAGRAVQPSLRRQAAESLRVLSQISYMHIREGVIIASLSPDFSNA